MSQSSAANSFGLLFEEENSLHQAASTVAGIPVLVFSSSEADDESTGEALAGVVETIERNPSLSIREDSGAGPLPRRLLAALFSG
jgi:hypothetical protein